MLLFCHDETCRGNRQPAHAEPEDDCAHCGAPLMDGNQCVISEAAPLHEDALHDVDLTAMEVCQLSGGHVYEGRLILTKSRILLGSCARCGLGVYEAVV